MAVVIAEGRENMGANLCYAFMIIISQIIGAAAGAGSAFLS